MPLPPPPSLESLEAAYGSRYRWMVLVVVGTGIVAGVLETSSFNVALPALSRAFGLGADSVQWAMTGFMAAMTLAMLPASWLLERFGFRRVFLAAVWLLAAASVAGCFARSFELVVLARVVQGAATGVLQPLALLVIMRLFPPEIQGRASGLMTLGVAATPAVAPAFGGVLVDAFGWPSIFLLSLPFCVAALVAGQFLLPAPRSLERRPFDLWGATLLGAATLSLMAGISALQRGGALELALAVVLAGGFVVHARRHKAPIVRLEPFANRSFAMGSLVSFTYGFGLYGSTYLIPVFLQEALGYSATASGSVLVPAGIALLLTTPLAGRLADSHSPRLVTTAGLVLFGLSFLPFAVRGGQIGQVELIAATVVGRIGLGLILPALNLASVRELPAPLLAPSAVVVSLMRQIGGVLGIAGTAVFIAWRQQALAGRADGLSSAFAQGFLLLGLIVGASVIAAWRMRAQEAADGAAGA
ncbi:DHA2 family efflux MFS transporter permease subunit [Piscinibacter sp.]|uniref:DHA2 family efflux MFS transporter permease subunit n=1 Tax=Piscinibacter sp. TaxID=1903157 RepID=UPI0039E53819